MSKPTHNLFKYFFQFKKKYILLSIAFLVFILFQLDKNNRFDDDLIGEQVYYFLQNGYVKSEMMRGYGNLHLDVYQAIFHKLFVYWGALWSSIIGWSLFSLHISSLLFLLFFILLLYLYLRKQSQSLAIFSIFFLLITYNILYYTNCFRPEIMLMTLGFGSFWALKEYTEYGKKNGLYIAAVLAGLAFATHPHGIIYCLAGGSMLFLYKKVFPSFIIYVLICGIIFLPIYFADIIIHDKMDVFWYQIKNDPIINVRQHHWYTPFMKLGEEHVRLFFNERAVTISLLLIFGILFKYKTLWKHQRFLLLYGTCCFIFLGLTTYSKSPQYLLLYYPFTLLIIAYSWKYIEEKQSFSAKCLYRLLLSAFIIVHLYFAGKQIFQNLNNLNKPSLSERNNAITKDIPLPHSTKSLLAFDEIIFDEIKDFKRIKTFAVYSFFREQEKKQKMTFTDILAAAKNDSVDYIVFNKHYISYYEITQKLVAGHGLKVITYNDSTLVLSLD